MTTTDINPEGTQEDIVGAGVNWTGALGQADLTVAAIYWATASAAAMT